MSQYIPSDVSEIAKPQSRKGGRKEEALPARQQDSSAPLRSLCAFESLRSPDLSPETLCSHAGQGFDDGQPLVTPIIQSTTFCRDGVDSQSVHAYSRCS